MIKEITKLFKKSLGFKLSLPFLHSSDDLVIVIWEHSGCITNSLLKKVYMLGLKTREDWVVPTFLSKG